MMFHADFLVNRVELKWADIWWGYRRKLIGWRTPVAIARYRIAESHYDTLLVQLTNVDKDTDWRVGEILEELAACDPSSEGLSHKKWLFLALQWLYSNRYEVNNVFEKLGEIYADFDYPVEISVFIPFMPPGDEYDPRIHTAEENRDRIFLKWGEYLHQAKSEIST